MSSLSASEAYWSTSVVCSRYARCSVCTYCCARIVVVSPRCVTIYRFCCASCRLQAQTGFAKATQELESKVEDKTVFLSIIQQVRLPSVQIHVRTVEEIEQLEGKTYRELTMSQHLPDAKKIYSNATDQTRTMAAFMYFVLYEQITGLKASQTGCSRDFQCQGTPFKRLVPGFSTNYARFYPSCCMRRIR